MIESESEVGGTWFYKNKRTALYKSLRTNLPRQIMAFSTMPMDKVELDERQFPRHAEIFEYLKRYAEDVNEFIRFNECVEKV